MTGISLATKGRICPIRVTEGGGGAGVIGGGIIYRDRKPTKKECELLYFPKVDTELIKMLEEGCELVHLPTVNTDLMETLREQEMDFSVKVKSVKIIG